MLLTKSYRSFFLALSLILATVYNLNAQRNIRLADQMYKKKVVRNLDLREKVNRPMFSKNRWITKVILDGFRQGQLIAYISDSLTTTQTQEDVTQKLSLSMVAEKDSNAIQLEEDTWGAEGDSSAKDNTTADISNELLPKDLELMRLTEEVIFDKQHSRMYFNILSLTLVIPAYKNEAGLEKNVCTFDYKELAVLFADKEKAEWYNTANDAQHQSLKDAFDLRMFASYIIKISNSNDEFLEDKYADARVAIMAADWVKQQLVEYEHHLWSF